MLCFCFVTSIVVLCQVLCSKRTKEMFATVIVFVCSCACLCVNRGRLEVQTEGLGWVGERVRWVGSGQGGAGVVSQLRCGVG